MKPKLARGKTPDNKSLIHIKFDYEEAVEAKRDILFSQIVALRIERAIKRFRLCRMQELKLKAGLYRRLKDLRNTIIKLEKTLPEFQIPKILADKNKKRKSSSSTATASYEPEIEKEENEDIESQLKDIQKRLDELQQNSMDLVS